MKLPSGIGSVTKRLGYGDRIHPARDWFLLLSLAAVLVAASVAWNAWIFVRAERGGSPGAATSTPAFDAAPIGAVRAVFEARGEEERRFRQEYRFVDPSR